MDSARMDESIEGIRSGPADELRSCCEDIIRLWRTAPVDELLSLKEQFRKLGMENREASLEEALISIAEKRPEPFTRVVTEPGHPLWRPALEVLSMVGNKEYLELFISLLPLCPKKDLCDLVRAIGCFDCARAVEALKGLLDSQEEPVALEAVLALKRCGAGNVAEEAREALRESLSKGTPMASVVEAVLKDMECGANRINPRSS